MTNKKIDRPLVIDLNGPSGNAFVLVGIACTLAKKLGYSDAETEELVHKMISSDYETLVNNFEKQFGSFVTLIR